MADLVKADIAAAICRRLREFAQHHQFRQRRHRADLPDSRRSPIVSTSSGSQEKRQAFVAADVVMGADIFVAGMADQDRSRHQFVETPAAMAAEAALAHIGDRMAARIVRRTACRPGPRVQRNSDTEMRSRCSSVVRSCRKFRYAGAAVQPAAARRTASCSLWCGRPRSTAAGAWK